MKFIFSFLLILIYFGARNASAQWIYSNWPGYTRIVDDSLLFGIGNDGNVYMSPDDGYSWTSTPYDLGKFFGSQSYFFHFEYASGNTILGVAGGTQIGFVIRSTDSGVHWDSVPSLPWIDFITGNDTSLYVSVDDTLYSSHDSGRDWHVIDTLPGFIDKVFEANNSNLFACALNPFGIYRSNDNGESWKKIINNLPIKNLTVESFDTIGSILLIGTVGQEFDTADDVFRSTDNGVTWIQSSVGMTKNDTCWQFAVAGSRVFAAMGFGGVYSSDDSGKTWQPQNDFGGQSIPNIEYLNATSETLFADFDFRRPLSDFNLNSVKQQSSNNIFFILFPNPTSGLVTLRGAAGTVTVENTLGEVVAASGVRELESGSVTLDLAGKPAGIYFARVETATGPVLEKIVKE